MGLCFLCHVIFPKYLNYNCKILELLSVLARVPSLIKGTSPNIQNLYIDFVYVCIFILEYRKLRVKFINGSKWVDRDICPS